MQIHTFTDPFTGAPFQAVQMNDHLIVDIPTCPNEKMVCHITGDYVKIPLKSFEYVPLMSSTDACMELHISRQRLVQLVKSEILHPIYLGNSQYFTTESVLEYKQSRKNGRPRKDA